MTSRFVTSLIGILLVSITLSCKNSDSVNPNYYVKAKIDGVEFVYDASNKNSFLTYNEPNDVVSGSLGFHITLKTSEQFGFTCIQPKGTKLDAMPVAGGGYTRNRTEVYAANSPISANGICSVTRLDDKIIEGTFYFDLYNNNGTGNTKMKVTEGQFRLER